MKFVDVAKNAAREAGDLVLEFKGKEKGIHFKAKRDIATIADKKSEELLHKILIEDNFNDHDFLSEESPFNEHGSNFRWIVDPIDGTGNFAHDNPLFCVSIGLLDGKVPIAGAIYVPTMDEMFSAQIGKGAFLNGKRIFASKQKKFYDLALAVEMPPKENVIRQTLLLEKKLALHHRVRTLGSAAMDLAYVACGRFDAFISAYLYTWDVAGGTAILNEAKGKTSSHDGKTIDLTQKYFNFVASNGPLHSKLLEKLKG